MTKFIQLNYSIFFASRFGRTNIINKDENANRLAIKLGTYTDSDQKNIPSPNLNRLISRD